MDSIFMWGTLILNPLGFACIVWALIFNHKLHVVPSWHRFGLMCCAIGLLGEAYCAYMILILGKPQLNDVGFWIMTDYGVIILAITTVVVSRRA